MRHIFPLVVAVITTAADGLLEIQEYLDNRTAKEILNCKGKPEWDKLRTLMQSNAARGYPIESTVSQLALDLVFRDEKLYDIVRHRRIAALTCPAWERMVHEMCFGISSTCSSDLNTERETRNNSSDSCFLGDLNARWMLARVMKNTVNNNGANVLNVSHFMETPQKARNIFNFISLFADWYPESSWPIEHIDALVSAGRCGSKMSGRRRARCTRKRYDRWDILEDSDVVNPKDVPKHRSHAGTRNEHEIWRSQVVYRISPVGIRSVFHTGVIPDVIRVWELGVHKTLAADVITALNMALRRSGKTLEFRNLLESQYPAYMDRCSLYVGMRCGHYQDAISETVRNFIIEREVWMRQSDGASMDFFFKADWNLAEFVTFSKALDWVVRAGSDMPDLLVVTQPVAYILPIRFGETMTDIPALLYMSNTFNYGTKPGLHAIVNEMMKKEIQLDRTTCISQFRNVRQGVFNMTVIGGLSIYMGANPMRFPTRGLLVLSRDSPDDCLFDCMIRRLQRELKAEGCYQGEIVFARDLKQTWVEIVKFTAVVFIPYAVFTLTLEELLNSAMPLFWPDHVGQLFYGAPAMIPSPFALKNGLVTKATNEIFTRYFATTFTSLSHLLELNAPKNRYRIQILRDTMANRVQEHRRLRIEQWKCVLGLALAGSVDVA